MASNQQPDWKIGEKWLAVLLLSFAMLAILCIGLLPGVFLPGLQDLIQRFSHLR
jgi:hypothetical protein